jgi:hypothetical protein
MCHLTYKLSSRFCGLGLVVCYGYGLLMVVLLYKNAPGLIWGYHYVNFSVFTYVSDHFLRFWACVHVMLQQAYSFAASV